MEGKERERQSGERAWRRDKDLAVKEVIKVSSGEPGLHLKAGVCCRVRRIKLSSLLDRKSLYFR